MLVSEIRGNKCQVKLTSITRNFKKFIINEWFFFGVVLFFLQKLKPVFLIFLNNFFINEKQQIRALKKIITFHVKVSIL